MSFFLRNVQWNLRFLTKITLGTFFAYCYNKHYVRKYKMSNIIDIKVLNIKSRKQNEYSQKKLLKQM